jgi:hypothetical protein
LAGEHEISKRIILIESDFKTKNYDLAVVRQ